MATSRAQRTGIWVITIAMTVGTVVGFVVMILASQEQQKGQAALAEYQSKAAQYQKDTDAQQGELDNEQNALSKKYFATVNEQKKLRVGKFDAKSLTETTSKTIEQGKGEAIGDDSTYATYYIGWTPDGDIFDGSIEKDSLKSPLIVRPGSVITGWGNMMKGKKIGGIYELSIKAEDAYGETGSGSIKPNSPIKFVVVPIRMLKTFTQPAITQEVLDAYAAQ